MIMMKTLTKAKAAQLDRCVKMLQEQTEEYTVTLKGTEQARQIFYVNLARKRQERFDVAFLTSQHGIIKYETMFNGTINQAPVFPREIARRALELNAAAIILGHNHPSGITEPSAADKNITDIICDSLSLLEIKVLDHFIVAGKNVYSFAEHGLL
jgi:DNA repair protein RadC